MLTQESYPLARSAQRIDAGQGSLTVARRENVASNERLASALAGGFALAWGLAQRSWRGRAAALIGSGLVYRGVSGHCPVYSALDVDTTKSPRQASARAALGVGAESAKRRHDIARSVTVQKSAEEVRRAWTQPETFAQAMGHLASLTPLAAGGQRWTVRDPLGHEHSWDTTLVVEEDGRQLRWATAEHAPLIKDLTLALTPAPGGRGTEMKLRLRLEYRGGALGALLTRLLGKAPAWAVERALGNMKSLLEAGELPSLTHNPAARASATP